MDYKEIQDRIYVILSTSETGSINFNQIYETAPDTLRINNSGSKTFVKWEGTMPDSITTLTTKEGPYTYTEILNILQETEWSSPDQGI
tara:strand:+ start:1017 stop:1280 length:264 start_codon:yes stop_codon:yes gene_type:complete